ncbi:Methionine aminopeptidase 1 [Pseudoclavibacter triregionum]|nr:Methionine aminopeptidase 1 [Pseudoclavibacter triregionum]
MRSLYKRPEQVAAMVPAGRLTCLALDAVEAAIRPGVTPLELDAIAERTIRVAGGEPNFALVEGYRHTICCSVNDAVVHGIPSATPLAPGDLVSIDGGALLDGWNGDSARTFLVPGGDAAREAEARRVSEAAREAMWAGIAALAKSRHLNAVGDAVEAVVDALVEADGRPLGILEGYSGHGIGRSMHEDPEVYNYSVRGRGPLVKPGLCVCIEPMLTGGSADVGEDADGWTVRTLDGSLAAHWEHTVLVHADGIWVSTALDGGTAGLRDYGVVPVLPAGA